MISEAGWRPVNVLLSSDNSNVFVEQFGDKYVTVFNTDTKEQIVNLKSFSGRNKAKEMVAGGEWRFEDGVLPVKISPETVRLLVFE
jgi:hypothetical protein